MLYDPNTFFLASIAFASSTVAGIFGFGGGMLLIAALPNFLPASAIIPVHSAVQLLSNSSRAALSWRDIHWGFVRQHAIGSIFGIAVALVALQHISLALIPAFIGLYILLNVWSEHFQQLVGRLESLYLLGAIQTGLSLVVGAPGPLPMPLLLRRLDNHHQIVCTLAVFLTVSHIMKIVIFVWLGFVFSEYLLPIVAMGVAAVAGSYVGTRLRGMLRVESFVWVVKILLSILALLAIYGAF